MCVARFHDGQTGFNFINEMYGFNFINIINTLFLVGACLQIQTSVLGRQFLLGSWQGKMLNFLPHDHPHPNVAFIQLTKAISSLIP